MSLYTELMHRKVFKIGAAYLVVAWLAVQAASIGFPAFDAPPWALRIFILVALLGFPISLVFAWAFDVTPEGVTAETSSRNSRTILVIAAGCVALAFAWYFLGQPTYRTDTEAALVTGTKARAATGATTDKPEAAPISEKSIAVLAFENMSADKDNEYFSDGIAEEILNSLSKVKDLKVAGRTSSFSFKGKNADLRVIGKALGVAHVLEGSVRKQGDKVRVTAQLIRTKDGFHLWSDTYDGDLKDVFALQESIARAITSELKVVLEGKQAARLVDAGTTNAEAYALYLQATSIFNRRDGDHFSEAIAALQEAIRLDPGYARAYARLTAMYAVLPSYSGANVVDAHAKVVQYAKKASALDPKLAEPYAALGITFGSFRGKQIDQFLAMERALELEPDDVTANFWYGLILIKAGYTARGTERLERALTLDPMQPNVLRWRGSMYMHAGDLIHAEQVTRRARDLGMVTSDENLGELAGAKGNREEAIRLWITGTKATMRGFTDEDRRIIAEGIYGDAAARARALALINARLAQPHEHVSQVIPEALFHLGQPERALEILHKRQLSETGEPFALLWSPQGRSMRTAPEFGQFIRDFGFTAVWDKYGPPDMCRKRGQGDYTCD